MAVNVFEGGRRIGTLFRGLVLVGGAVTFLFGSGYRPRPIFEAETPDRPFQLSGRDCVYGTDVSHDRFDLTLQDGTALPWVGLCYRAVPSTDTDKIILTGRRPDRSLFGYSKDAPEAVEYMRLRTEAFEIPADQQAVTKQFLNDGWWKERREFFGTVFAWTAGLVLFLSAFQWIVGWIVRGFAGIPNDKDVRALTRPERDQG